MFPAARAIGGEERSVGECLAGEGRIERLWARFMLLASTRPRLRRKGSEREPPALAAMRHQQLVEPPQLLLPLRPPFGRMPRRAARAAQGSRSVLAAVWFQLPSAGSARSYRLIAFRKGRQVHVAAEIRCHLRHCQERRPMRRRRLPLQWSSSLKERSAVARIRQLQIGPTTLRTPTGRQRTIGRVLSMSRK